MCVVIACRINTKAQNEDIDIQVYYVYRDFNVKLTNNPFVSKVSIDPIFSLIFCYFLCVVVLKITVYLDEKKYLCNCSPGKGLKIFGIQNHNLCLIPINIPSYILNKIKYKFLYKSLQRILMIGFFTVLNGKICVRTTQMFRFPIYVLRDCTFYEEKVLFSPISRQLSVVP